MAVLTAEEREALRDSTRRLLERRCDEADVRRVMETPDGFDRVLWGELAGLGLLGLVIPEAYGGAGASAVELEAVMEEVGAVLLPGPLLSSGVLAAGLLLALGDEEACERLLPGIADGSRILTLALTGSRGSWTEDGVEVAATAEADSEWWLEGVADYVTHGQVSDTLLVLATGSEGLGVYELHREAARVQVDALPSFDRTLRLARIRFNGAPARRLNASGPVWPAVESALDLARVALAGEQAGAGRRVLDFTVQYAKSRVQFGRAIGSFQALKHMAADLLLESESSISAARAAARALAEGAADKDAAVSLAAFYCADAFVQITATAIQMHGGIAFTWDHPAHLYLRRARADAQLFGGSDAHRERYIQALGG